MEKGDRVRPRKSSVEKADRPTKLPSMLRPHFSQSLAHSSMRMDFQQNGLHTSQDHLQLPREPKGIFSTHQTAPMSRSLVTNLGQARAPKPARKGLASESTVSSAVTLDPRQVAVLKSDEMEAIKRLLMGNAPTQSARARQEGEERRRAKDQAHRMLMAKLDAEKESLEQELGEFERERQEQRALLLQKAEEAKLEALEEVKLMNQLVNYAKAARVREFQVQENEMLREVEKEEQARLASVVEIERLKGLKKDIEKEEQRKQGMVTGSQVIVQQIQHRDLEKQKKSELLKQEGQEILKKIAQDQEEEKRKAQERKLRQSKELETMYSSNQEQIKLKELKAKEEADMNEKIAKYQIQKQIKDAEAREAALKKKQEKEFEINKLREIQEKVQDNTKQIDDLRARRAMEKADRLAREKDALEARKRSDINNMLSEARKHQTLSKQRQLEQQALSEKLEFQKQVELEKAKRELDVEAERQKQQRVGAQ